MKITDRHGYLALVIFAAVVAVFCVVTYYITGGGRPNGAGATTGDGIPISPAPQK